MIACYYSFSFCSRCYFYLPIFVLWLLRHGYSQFQVTLFISIFFFATVCAELPTGWWTDRWGRRRALIVGSLTQTIGVACLAVPHHAWLIVVGEVLLGIGQAFHTGAKEAFLYDHLQAHGQQHQYQSYYAESRCFEFVAMSVGALAGTSLYLVSGAAPFWGAAIVFAIGGGFAGCLREPVRSRPVGDATGKLFRESWATIRRGPSLLRQVIGFYCWFFSVVLIVATTVSQPYLVGVGLPVQLFGVAYLFFHLLAVAGAFFAARWTTAWQQRGSYLGLGLSIAGALVAMAIWPQPAIYWVIGAIYFGWGMLLPLTSAAINPCIDSSCRATVLAIQDFLQTSVFIGIVLVIGWSVDRVGFALPLGVLGAVSVCVAIGVACWMRSILSLRAP